MQEVGGHLTKCYGQPVSAAAAPADARAARAAARLPRTRANSARKSPRQRCSDSAAPGCSTGCAG